MTTKVLEGTHAISYAVQRCRVGVVAAYPITPSSGVVELLAEMCANGQMDARFIAVESEHSSLATCAGASQTGVRAFTATSSHGLLYMHEMLHWCAGARLPIVLANVNRAVGAPWNILCDQGDSLSQRDTGWLQYYCEDNQEVLDTIVQAYKVAESVLLPAMVCLDAFFLSHTSEPVSVPELEEVDRYLPPYAPEYQVSTADPHAFGGLPSGDGYMEYRARLEAAMRLAETAAVRADDEFFRLFGRRHPIVEEYRTEDADVLLVASGTAAGTARAVIDARRDRGTRVGLVKIHLFRPFPFGVIRRVLGRVKKVAVIDRSISFGHGGITASEIRAALAGQPAQPTVFSFIAGLGGRDITLDTIDEIVEYASARAEPEDDTLWVGLKE
jgi:pyruvate/2-oxoacid:ferredoxin oxidoreductase alpha subunit